MFKGKFELCDVVVGEHGAIEEVVSAGEDNSLIGDVVDMKGTYILPGMSQRPCAKSHIPRSWTNPIF